MSASTQRYGVLLRYDFAGRNRRKPALHRSLGSRELVGWLGALGHLRAPAALDRSILDQVHQDPSRSARLQPGFVFAVTLSCVVFGMAGKFHSPGVDQPVLVSEVHLPKAPVHQVAKKPDGLALATLTAAASQPLLATVRPLVTERRRAKSLPSLQKFAAAIPHHAIPATESGPTIRLAAATLPPATPALPSQRLAEETGAEVIPAASELGRPPVHLTNALSWSGTELAAAPIKLHERVNSMVSPTGLLAALPQQRDSNQRPIYKRAWFIGMLGVAATGVAAGVTAAVVTAHQGTHGITAAGQPITLRLGPT